MIKMMSIKASLSILAMSSLFCLCGAAPTWSCFTSDGMTRYYPGCGPHSIISTKDAVSDVTYTIYDAATKEQKVVHGGAVVKWIGYDFYAHYGTAAYMIDVPADGWYDCYCFYSCEGRRGKISVANRRLGFYTSLNEAIYFFNSGNDVKPLLLDKNNVPVDVKFSKGSTRYITLNLKKGENVFIFSPFVTSVRDFDEYSADMWGMYICNR